MGFWGADLVIGISTGVGLEVWAGPLRGENLEPNWLGLLMFFGWLILLVPGLFKFWFFC